MICFRVVIFVVFCWSTASLGQEKTDISIAKTFSIYSSLLDEDRPIIISLPKEYEETDAHYPVVFILDGLQNVFHTVGSVEVLSRTGKIPPVIIVGIQSTNRTRDFTPSMVTGATESGGGRTVSRLHNL